MNKTVTIYPSIWKSTLKNLLDGYMTLDQVDSTDFTFSSSEDSASTAFTRLAPIELSLGLPDAAKFLELQLVAIDAVVQKTRVDAADKLHGLEELRKSLLALPAPTTGE